MNILVLNCGSSSLKFAIFNLTHSDNSLWSGLIEKIGTSEEVKISWLTDTTKENFTLPACDHHEAMLWLVSRFDDLKITPTLQGIGHRFVHGGEQFKKSILITPSVIKILKDCLDLAPLHNPANFEGIELTQKVFPNLPQAIVFDTAFHASIPDYAYRYALPKEYYEQHQIRRYGFHGTSHKFIAQKATEVLKSFNYNTKGIINLHLGNGCSSCAILNGQSADTSMGFTPLEGLVMGTRSGDIDPGVCIYLAEKCGMNAQEVSNLLNKKSGLLGVSGVSNDLRTLLEKEKTGHRPSILALNIFAYKVAQSVGKMMVALPHLDALVFTGGIGENSPAMRARILEHLQCFQLQLDLQSNAEHGKNHSGFIQSGTSSAKILVIPTQEEWLIAQETTQLIMG